MLTQTQINSQLTQTHLQLHQKLIRILKGIERCNAFMADAKSYIICNKNTPWFKFTRHVYDNEYNKYKRIKNRLLNSYADTIQQLIMPAMENNIKQIETFGYAEAV